MNACTSIRCVHDRIIQLCFIALKFRAAYFERDTPALNAQCRSVSSVTFIGFVQPKALPAVHSKCGLTVKLGERWTAGVAIRSFSTILSTDITEELATATSRNKPPSIGLRQLNMAYEVATERFNKVANFRTKNSAQMLKIAAGTQGEQLNIRSSVVRWFIHFVL